MTLLYLVLAALAPVVVLLWYIYRKDSAQPEPAGWLIKAFFYGVASISVSLALTNLLTLFTGLDFNIEQQGSVAEAFANAFVWAAIPEETAKLLMLWLLLRRNPHFDERLDGIVYAVCVGMGFAAVENVMYLYDGLGDGSWMSVGVSRALFAVPGHFLFAVLMGYYYSLSHFGLRRGAMTRLLIWLAPVLAHGLYDGILFSMKTSDMASAIGLVVFLVFFSRLRKLGKKRIEKLRAQQSV